MDQGSGEHYVWVEGVVNIMYAAIPESCLFFGGVLPSMFVDYLSLLQHLYYCCGTVHSLRQGLFVSSW